jgi:hypothetical protein
MTTVMISSGGSHARRLDRGKSDEPSLLTIADLPDSAFMPVGGHCGEPGWFWSMFSFFILGAYLSPETDSGRRSAFRSGIGLAGG